MTAKTVMDIAISYLGTKESPANSNNVIFNTHYYGRAVNGSNYAWCCAYVWDCFRMANASSLFYDGQKTAYCPTVYNWAKAKGLVVDKSKGQYGDVVLFNWGKSSAQHIGFIECKNADGTYNCIEGNTSLTSNDNGGCVMRRRRYQSEIMQIWRPQYSGASAPVTPSQPKVEEKTGYTYTQFVRDIQGAIGAEVDGVAGPETIGKTITLSTSINNRHKAVKYVQQYLNSLGFNCGTADGVFGKKTKDAVIEFQKTNGCIADGEITAKAKTWKKLLRM